MRRQQLIGWIVVGGLAASACSGASGAPRRDSTQLPEDRPIRLRGSLEIVWGDHAAGCKVESRTAQVESRVVEIRDEAGDVVASAVTGRRAVLSSSFLLCRAETRFEAHLPRRHSYAFNVGELPGSGEPVSFEFLKTRGYECPLTITVAIDLKELPDLSCTPPKYRLGPPPDYSIPHW